ncbi:MAG: hypothetical protein JWN10_2741 [Solirubrobacterales bacterium]|nr:hypothetical protein [Solirubrobacterales bacterium]
MTGKFRGALALAAILVIAAVATAYFEAIER